MEGSQTEQEISNCKRYIFERTLRCIYHKETGIGLCLYPWANQFGSGCYFFICYKSCVMFNLLCISYILLLQTLRGMYGKKNANCDSNWKKITSTSRSIFPMDWHHLIWSSLRADGLIHVLKTSSYRVSGVTWIL